MNILVFNCGSSSLTFKLFDAKDYDKIEVVFSGKAHRVGVKGSEASFIEFNYDNAYDKKVIEITRHSEAADLVLQKLEELKVDIDFIGHRWGHSAGKFNTILINENVLSDFKFLIPLMPIHHPAMLSVIQKCRKTYPEKTQYATADGSFHSTIPGYAYTYALPKEIIQKFGFRKYGFHGLSYQYVVREASRFLNTPLKDLKIVACHLGTGGSSVSAIRAGKSVDTSMGFTALPGLMMSTRSGDLDPMLSLYLLAVYSCRPDDLLDMLNKKSGLLGISGFSSDLRDILHGIEEGKEQSDLALKMYVHRLKKFIGSYIAILKGIDILIFTDDIGVHNWQLREKVCENMEWCGLLLDKKINCKAITDENSLLSKCTSKVKILSIPNEEEFVICLEGVKLLEKENVSIL